MRHLTKYQFIVLRLVGGGKEIDAGLVRDSTLYWLCQRGYVGINRDGYLALTPEGFEALQAYSSGDLPERKQAGPLTKRTESILRIIRRRAA